MTVGYQRPVPVVRDLLYDALYGALRSDDYRLQPREDGTDLVDRAYAASEAEFWHSRYLYGTPKSKSSAYIHYWASEKIGVSAVGTEVLEPSLMTLGLATSENLPEVLAFLDSNFRDLDDKFDRLAGPDIATLLLRLGLADRVLQAFEAIDADEPRWESPITRRQIINLVKAKLSWVQNFELDTSRMLMIAVHMAYDTTFYETVKRALGEDTLKRFRARIELKDYGALIHPIDSIDRRRVKRNMTRAAHTRQSRMEIWS